MTTVDLMESEVAMAAMISLNTGNCGQSSPYSSAMSWKNEKVISLQIMIQKGTQGGTRHQQTRDGWVSTVQQ